MYTEDFKDRGVFMSRENSVDMLSGPITGKILIFVVPVILSGVLQLLFNAADIVVLGRFGGNDSMADVGSTSSVISLLVNTYFMCGIMDTINGSLRGIGYLFSSMCITLFCVCGIRIIFVLSYFQIHRDYITLFWSYPISWLAAVIMETALFAYGYNKIKKKAAEKTVI